MCVCVHMLGWECRLGVCTHAAVGTIGLVCGGCSVSFLRITPAADSVPRPQLGEGLLSPNLQLNSLGRRRQEAGRQERLLGAQGKPHAHSFSTQVGL